MKMNKKKLGTLTDLCLQAITEKQKRKVIADFPFGHPILQVVGLYMTKTEPLSTLSHELTRQLPWNNPIAQKSDFEFHKEKMEGIFFYS